MEKEGGSAREIKAGVQGNRRECTGKEGGSTRNMREHKGKGGRARDQKEGVQGI